MRLTLLICSLLQPNLLVMIKLIRMIPQICHYKDHNKWPPVMLLNSTKILQFTKQFHNKIPIMQKFTLSIKKNTKFWLNDKHICYLIHPNVIHWNRQTYASMKICAKIISVLTQKHKRFWLKPNLIIAQIVYITIIRCIHHRFSVLFSTQARVWYFHKMPFLHPTRSCTSSLQRPTFYYGIMPIVQSRLSILLNLFV